MNKCENFKKIANLLVGEKAVLYAYLPGFSWLEVAVKKKDKVIILVFRDVIRAKTILKIEVELESAEETYLVLRNCNYLKFQLNLEIDSLFVVQESEWLTIKDLSEIFLVKCSAVELWSESDFDLYNDEIEETFKTERDEVTRRSLSIEDLDIN